MFGLFKTKGEAEREEAREAFERAVAMDAEGREARGVRIRTALRCRSVLDAVFQLGSKSVGNYEEAAMIALAGGEDAPPLPFADEDTCYQTIKSVNGDLVAYVPLIYCLEMFNLGVKYQKGEVSIESAIEVGQAIADKLGGELKLDQYAVQPIVPLDFLVEVGSSSEVTNDAAET